jgi:hypothetical protein
MQSGIPARAHTNGALARRRRPPVCVSSKFPPPPRARRAGVRWLAVCFGWTIELMCSFRLVFPVSAINELETRDTRAPVRGEILFSFFFLLGEASSRWDLLYLLEIILLINLDLNVT